MNCKNCGSYINNWDTTCPFCGAQQGSSGASFDGYNAPQDGGHSRPTQEKSIVSLVLGILSLVFCSCPIIGLPIGVAGIVFSAIATSRGSQFGTTGLIMSIIGSAIGIFLIVTIGSIYGFFFALASEIGLL